MLRWPNQNPAPTIHQDHLQFYENTTLWHHLCFFVHKRVKLSWRWKGPSLLVLSLLLALSAWLLSPTLPQPLCTICQSRHPQSCNSSANSCQMFSKASIYFPKFYSHLAPYLNISILPMTSSVCLCAFGLFYSIFLSKCNQNSTCSSLDAATCKERCDDHFKRYWLSIKRRWWVFTDCPYSDIALRSYLLILSNLKLLHMFICLIWSNTAVWSFYTYMLGWFSLFWVAINCLFPLCVSVCVDHNVALQWMYGILETQQMRPKAVIFKHGSKTGG